MEVKPTAHPTAYDMCKQIVAILQAHYLSKDSLKGKYWLIDFIESFEGITYFLQVKAFDCVALKSKQVTKCKSLPRTIKTDNRRRVGMYF